MHLGCMIEMVGQNHSKYHGEGVCCIGIYYGTWYNIVLEYTMEHGTILVSYAGMRFELDYNDNLYCVDDMLCVYHSDP